MEVLESGNEYNNLILGDSRVVAGIDPLDLGENYYNLALGGGTPMEGYFMLRKLLENERKIDTILISYAPIHFEQSEMFWDRQLKYNFYDLKDIDEIFNELNTGREQFWSYDGEQTYAENETTKYLRKAYLNYFKFPSELRAELGKSLLLRGYSNYKVYDEITRRKGTYDFGKNEVSHELNVEAKREVFKPKEIIVKSLEKTFQLAIENDIQIVYVSLPMNEASYEALSQTYRKGVANLDAELRTKFPAVHFINDPIFYYGDNYFGDASHLNKKGRIKFTSSLKSQIKGGSNEQGNAIVDIKFLE